MTLKGSLEVLNLSDIFQSLSLNQQTGTLRVTDGKREKLVHFASGEITLLASEKRVRIGEMLVASGKISQEDLEFALQQQKKSKKRLGEILVEEGFVSEEDIADIVRQQIEAEIYDLFLWKGADFEFLPDHVHEKLKNPSHGITKLAFNTSSLIMEAMRRLDDWGIIKKEITTLKEVYKVVNPNPQALEGVDLPERMKGEIKLIDGEKSLEQIAEETSLSEYELCKLVFELKSRGIVAPLTPQELAERADEAYKGGKYRQATSLYERLVEVLPKNLSIRWHLAESAKAFGDEKRALEQFEYIASQLEGTRDTMELARVYKAILEIQPDRKEISEKLKALDKAKWFGSFLKLGVGVAVLLVVAGVGAVFAVPGLREKILGPKKTNGPVVGEENEAVAQDLLKKANTALAKAEYEEAYKLGWTIVTDHPKTKARKDVKLPMLIRSEPTGKEVWIDDEKYGLTDKVFLVPAKDPGGKYKVEIRDGGRTLLTKWVEAGKYQTLDLSLFRTPVWKAAATGPVRGAPVFRDPNVVYFASLDGRIYGHQWDDPQAPRVLELPLTADPRDLAGYFVSGPVLADDLLLYATLDGDLVAFNVNMRTRAFSVRAAAEPLLARPVVTEGGMTVAVAGNDGAVRFFPLRARPVAEQGKLQMANRITAGLTTAAAADDQWLVFAAGRQNRVVAIDAKTKAEAWWHEGEGDYLAAPLPVSASALLAGDAAGALSLLDRKSGAVIWTVKLGADAAVHGLEWVDEAVYATVRTGDGHGELVALDLADGKEKWRVATPRRPGRPVAAGANIVVAGDEGIEAYARDTGTEAWEAKTPKPLRGEPVFHQGRIYVGCDDGVLYGFDPQ